MKLYETFIELETIWAEAERLIGLLQKKMNEIGAATSAQVAAAGKAVLA